MKLHYVKACLFMIMLAGLYSCNKPAEPHPHGDNYIRLGQQYFPLESALAIYHRSGANTTLFTLQLVSADDNTAAFDLLKVSNTTTLPEGTFTFHTRANEQDMLLNKFHALLLRYGKAGKTVLNSSLTPIQLSTLMIRKHNDQYQIKGIIKQSNKEYEVSYKGQVEHIQGR
jgi:hypothetical protein